MPVIAPTKGNLSKIKRSLALAKMGYELMDRKRNILIREMMLLIDSAKQIQAEIDTTFTRAYSALQEANIKLGACQDIALATPVDNSLQLGYRSVMGVEIPIVTASDFEARLSYGFFGTDSCLLYTSFGVMFGDVGQGAVLILAGLLAWRFLKLSLGKIIAVVGCSSVVFGFVYGSVFGNEDLLPGFKVFESVDNTNKILLCSVAMGLLFISIAMIYNIYNGIRQKDLGKALFSQNGVAGFIFYWAVIVGVLCTLLTNIKLLSPVYIALLILLPLLLIFAQKPLGDLVARRKDWMPKEKGGFIVENFFELFEILLSFVSNTVSFVRIGAFALNHVGMMMVVFALMDSVGTIGSPIVFIIGNVFVMCLEGLIVGIQVLRLEFYELFGRFYSGTGVPYQPFTVHFRREKKS